MESNIFLDPDINVCTAGYENITKLLQLILPEFHSYIQHHPADEYSNLYCEWITSRLTEPTGYTELAHIVDITDMEELYMLLTTSPV